MSTPTADPYELLGVARDADEQTIKKAFRSLARKLHPDVSDDPQAEEKFKAAAEAYEILSDPERRAIYDRYGHEGLRSGGRAPNFESFGSFGDLFEAFFGGGGVGGFGRQSATGPVQGGDVALGVEMTLEEAATGTQVDLRFEAIDACERCGGDGAEPGSAVRTCERCDGQGMLQAVSRSPFGQVVRTVACDVCAGSGRVPERGCSRCDGRGREVRERHLQADVPAGIADGQRICLSGRGHAGERGGPPGDLYLHVRVRAHEHFLRDGDDLVTVVDVSAPAAALGTTLTVPSVWGGEVDVDVPPGIQPGGVLRVRGAGMPAVRRPGRRGDLRIVVNVVIPRRLDKRQRRLMEELAEALGDGEGGGDGEAPRESLTDKLKRLVGGE
jgi:molecular chaperone DnaJ